MKKNILFASVILFTISLFTGCSSSDSDNNDENTESEKLFLKINISGTEYNSSGLFATGNSGEENCNDNGDLFLQYVGDVENSTLYLECNFVHFENIIDFNNQTKNIQTNSNITDINDLWETNFDKDACSLNNDFSIIFEDKVSNKYLRFKPNATKKHSITKVKQVSEDSAGKQFIVEGNFSAVFLKGSTEIPVNGSYRIKIDVLK